MNHNAVLNYLRGLTGRIFKILPLKEKTQAGLEVYLRAYLSGLHSDVQGSLCTFPELCEDEGYLTVCTKTTFLCMHAMEMTTGEVRKEVFRVLRILNRMCEEAEDGHDGRGGESF